MRPICFGGAFSTRLIWERMVTANNYHNIVMSNDEVEDRTCTALPSCYTLLDEACAFAGQWGTHFPTIFPMTLCLPDLCSWQSWKEHAAKVSVLLCSCTHMNTLYVNRMRYILWQHWLYWPMDLFYHLKPLRLWTYIKVWDHLKHYNQTFYAPLEDPCSKYIRIFLFRILFKK